MNYNGKKETMLVVVVVVVNSFVGVVSRSFGR